MFINSFNNNLSWTILKLLNTFFIGIYKKNRWLYCFFFLNKLSEMKESNLILMILLVIFLWIQTEIDSILVPNRFRMGVSAKKIKISASHQIKLERLHKKVKPKPNPKEKKKVYIYEKYQLYSLLSRIGKWKW